MREDRSLGKEKLTKHHRPLDSETGPRTFNFEALSSVSTAQRILVRETDELLQSGTPEVRLDDDGRLEFIASDADEGSGGEGRREERGGERVQRRKADELE